MVIDRYLNNFIKRAGRFITEQFPDLCIIGAAPLHVLKAAFVGFIIRDIF